MNTLIQKIIRTSALIVIGVGLILKVPLALADSHRWPYGWLAKHDHDDDDDQGEHHWHKHKRYYQYYYYPAQQVYYSPVKQVYYYQTGGNWIYAPVLPPTIHLGNKVSISLGTPTPYLEHPYVIQQYPVVIVR